MIDPKPSVSITESNRSFEGEALLASSDPVFQDRLRGVDVLLIPFRSIPEYDGPVFATLTRDLYEFLARESPQNLTVEVATDADEIDELVLHGELLVLGEFLVTWKVADLLVNMLASFIYDRVGKRKGKIEQTTVRCTIIIASDGSREIKYDGPADTFQSLLQAAVAPQVSPPPDVSGTDAT